MDLARRDRERPRQGEAREVSDVARAVAVLEGGGLLALPTETVYGLAGDAANPLAVAKIFAAKGRPSFNPLISHVLGLDEAEEQATLPKAARDLAEAFWPGPLTIVAPRCAKSSVAELACAGLGTIALRAPAHPLAREVLAAFARPVAAPSANRSGRLSPTSASHVREEFGEALDFVLDGGPCRIGLESTIVGFGEDGRPLLLRPGGVAREAIEALVGPLGSARGERPLAPGMLQSHYAPRARLRLDALRAEPDEVFLGFGGIDGEVNLSPAGDLVEAAANLFAALRALDATGADVIAVAPIPRAGLGEAINDRLARAAAAR